MDDPFIQFQKIQDRLASDFREREYQKRKAVEETKTAIEKVSETSRANTERLEAATLDLASEIKALIDLMSLQVKLAQAADETSKRTEDSAARTEKSTKRIEFATWMMLATSIILVVDTLIRLFKG